MFPINLRDWVSSLIARFLSTPTSNITRSDFFHSATWIVSPFFHPSHNCYPDWQSCHSHIDNSISLLFGPPWKPIHKLQLVQNPSALNVSLLVKFPINFTILLFTFILFRPFWTSPPSYCSDLLHTTSGLWPPLSFCPDPSSLRRGQKSFQSTQKLSSSGQLWLSSPL